MLAEKAENPAVTPVTHRASFFRESGWLMIANVTGGALNWAVHFMAKKTGPTEYGVFLAFLAVAMCIPSMPLQLVFAQQTAKGIATDRQPQLARLIRLTWLATFLFWAVSAVVVLIFQGTILERWKIPNPAALWVAVPMVLFSIWGPIFSGVLQGQQNFLWLGWSMILNAVVRLGVAVLAVLALGGYATGMLTGVLLGMAVAALIGIWCTRDLWIGHSLPFEWRPVLRQVVPLMLGAAAFQFLFTADTMFAKSYFDSDTVGFYGSAGTLSRALMWLVGPLAAVMFPRIVHSAAKDEKTDLVSLVLLGTAILAIVGAVGLSLLGPWVVKLVYGEKFVHVASQVLPWYASAMVPLALANVLLSNLFARSFFKIIPALCVLAIAYAFALTRLHDSLVTILKTLGCANLLLLALAAWFTWGARIRNESKVPSPKS